MYRALGFRMSGFNDTWPSEILCLEHNFTVFSDYSASFYNIALALPMILFDANLLGEMQPLIITLCLVEIPSALSVQACVWGEKQEGRVQLHGAHWVQRVLRRTVAGGWGAFSEPWSLRMCWVHWCSSMVVPPWSSRTLGAFQSHFHRGDALPWSSLQNGGGRCVWSPVTQENMEVALTHWILPASTY